LNLFCNPRSPHIRLSRVLRYLDGVGESDDVLGLGVGDRSASSPFRTTVVPQAPRRASIGSPVQTQRDFSLNAKLRRNIQQQQHRAGDHRFGESRVASMGLGVHGIGDLTPDVTESDGTPVSNAVWWLLQESDEERRVGKEGARMLQGEIHLPSELQPSCPFPLFNLSVCT
jgi:hypothetical protein